MKGAKGTQEKEVKPEAPWGNSTFEAEAKEVSPTSEYSTTYYAKPGNCKAKLWVFRMIFHVQSKKDPRVI